MVPESKSSIVTFPYERQASMGEEMPTALTYPDQILYLSFRMLYAQLRVGLIDRETAICEKRKLIKEYQHYQFMEQLCRERVALIKQTEIARSEYRKNRTLENADKLVSLIEGRKDVAAARKAELVGVEK